VAAEEALQLARELGDRRLLADVLRRCARGFSMDGAERVRAMYAESVALFRTLGNDDDTARALTWWGKWEAEIGNYSGAAKQLIEAKPLAGDELAVSIMGDVAACYLVTGDRANAEPAAREALELAAKFRYPIESALAITYVAALADDRNAVEIALLVGYVDERFRTVGWEPVNYDREITQNIRQTLQARLSEAELSELSAEGAAWNEEEAVARALRLSSRT
jgi:hypothetical protein